jgi:hypothetical protein
MVVLSNVLGDLAGRIRLANEAAHKAALSSIEHTLESGRLLLRAKDACAHGEWLPFLKQAGIEERTAQRHMKLVVSELKSDMVSDLGGVIPALDFLAEPALPPKGQTLFLANRAGSVTYFGWIWESVHCPGYYHYHVNRHTKDQAESVGTKQPMKPVRMDCDGKSINVFWYCFCEQMNCSVSMLEILGLMDDWRGGVVDWEEEAVEAVHRDIAEAELQARAYVKAQASGAI